MPDQESGAAAPAPLSRDEVVALYAELKGISSGRNSEYAMARTRYIGNHWGDAENPNPDGKRYTLKMNYIRPTVDKTVALLLGQMPGIQVMPPGVDQQSRDLAESEEAILYATWDDNAAELVFRRVAHNRALLRRGLIYYWWDATARKVRFRSVAPDNFYPVYDGEEIVECIIISRRHTRSLKRAYPGKAAQIKSDSVGDDVFDEGRWTRQVNQASDILDQYGSALSSNDRAAPLSGQTTVIDWYDKHGNWVRVMGNAVHSQNLDYGMGKVPVIEFVNSLPGDEREPRSEIDDILDLNIYLDQLLSQQADIIKRYSNPTILDKQSGQSPQQIRQTVQGDGGVLPIKRDGDVVLLNWTGTPPDISQQFDRVLNGIYDLSGKPASSYGQILSNQSGVASNMAMSPAVLTTSEHQSIFGFGLMELNKCILVLTERNMQGQQLEIRIGTAARPGTTSYHFYDIKIMGDEIGGWTKNRIKWPSALRTDDPIFVQNEIAKSKADPSNPPNQSQNTTMENLGIEDVEEERRRIKSELEDPRLHPERLQASISAAQAMQQSMIPQPMQGLDPAMSGEMPDEGIPMDAALEAGGSPAGPKSSAGGGRASEY